MVLLRARYLQMAALVGPGQDVKNPQSMALIHVDLAGLKAVGCKNLINSGMVLVL